MTVKIAKREMDEQAIREVHLSALDFDITPLTTGVIKKDLDGLLSNYINKFGKHERDDLALVVGRFQPPHLGHLFQILAALEIADHVVIGLGSANSDINKPKFKDKRSIQADIDNPLPASEREFLLTHLLRKIGGKSGKNLLDRISFVHINDLGNDEKWRNQVLDQVEELNKGPLDVLVANDGWVKRIFDEFGMHTYSVGFIKNERRKRYEGRKTRKMLRKRKIFAPRGQHVVIRE